VIAARYVPGEARRLLVDAELGSGFLKGQTGDALKGFLKYGKNGTCNSYFFEDSVLYLGAFVFLCPNRCLFLPQRRLLAGMDYAKRYASRSSMTAAAVLICKI